MVLVTLREMLDELPSPLLLSALFRGRFTATCGRLSRTAYAFDPDVAGKVLLFLNKMSIKHKEYVLVSIGKARETQLI